MTTLIANIRHNLDPVLVQTSTAKQVTDYEDFRVRRVGETIALLAKYEQSVASGTVYKDWHRKPQDVQSVIDQHNEWIQREQEYYSTVRVVELPTGEKRFLLVYGDVDDATVTEGTGPFESFDTAAKWFYGSGR
jgi:hypothetical protein